MAWWSTSFSENDARASTWPYDPLFESRPTVADADWPDGDAVRDMRAAGCSSQPGIEEPRAR
jgi:hypothetical protein